MLVLSRKPDERIIIGDEIEVIVEELFGHVAKITLLAPKPFSTSIHEFLRADEGTTPAEVARAKDKSLVKLAQTPMKTRWTLSLRENQAVWLTPDIRVVNVHTRHDKVRFGIEAPREVPVHRWEVHDAIQRQKS